VLNFRIASLLDIESVVSEIYSIGSPCFEDLNGKSSEIGGGFGNFGGDWDIGKGKVMCFFGSVGISTGAWMGINLCKTEIK
jgi:hypothetical protein